MHSQGLPYIRGIIQSGLGKFTLLTFEKKEHLKKYGPRYVSKLRQELKEEGIDWRFLYYHKYPALLAKLFDITSGSVYSIILIIAKRVKLIHARGITSAVMALGPKCILGVKIIFDMRNFLAEAYVSAGIWKPGSLNFKLVKQMEKLVLENAFITIVESHPHFRALEKYKYGNIEIIPCCVDLDKFRYNRDGGKPTNDFGLDNRFYLIYIGSLGTWYMMDEMLDFYENLSKDISFSDCGLILATRHSPTEIIERIKAKGLDMEKISILNLDHQEIPGVLSLSRLGMAFIKPYERTDSFPTKIGEYLASGLPVVLNKGMGDAEVLIKENKVGVIIDSFSEEGYKEAVNKLKLLLKEGESLNWRCRQVAEKHLSLKKAVDRYCVIYKNSMK